MWYWTNRGRVAGSAFIGAAIIIALLFILAQFSATSGVSRWFGNLLVQASKPPQISTAMEITSDAEANWIDISAAKTTSGVAIIKVDNLDELLMINGTDVKIVMGTDGMEYQLEAGTYTIVYGAVAIGTLEIVPTFDG